MKRLQILPPLSVYLLLVATAVWAQPYASSIKNVTFSGTQVLTTGVNNRSLPPGFHFSLNLDTDVGFDIPGVSGNNRPARLPAAGVPRPTGNSIASGSFFGFPGLTQFDQAVAPTGAANGFNFEVEPPDQGLAVGNGFVVEAINDAIAFFQTNGTFLGFEALNVLYNLPPAATIDLTTGQILSFGPFLSDPRVYYDSTNGFFIVSVIEIDTDSTTGNFASGSHVLIAVIPNTLSAVSNFSLDVTNDGDANFGACPCFGDQPLIGADANGFYVSTNAFNIAQETFRGEQLYAISLSALETGPPGSITAVRFNNLTQAGEPAFSIQPATVPPGGSFETRQGGTEYLVSSFHSSLDDRLTVWALMNTASLNTATPTLTLVNNIVTTASYGNPPATEQKSGSTPLLDFLASPQSTFGVFKNHLELVLDNDDRLQQLVFAVGKLWTSVPTVVKTRGPVRAGAAWFILTPAVGAGQVVASVFNQGYIAIDSPHQNSVMFPAVGVNAAGKAVISFSLVGEDFFPSAAYAMLDAVNGAGPIVISGPGIGPNDAASGYAPFGFRAARWGDYSAAVSDESGNIWMGAQMIPVNPPLILLANWGTFITEVVP